MDAEGFRQEQVKGTKIEAEARTFNWRPTDLPTLRAAYSDRTATLMGFFAAFAYNPPTEEIAPGEHRLPPELRDLGFNKLTYFESTLADGLALVAESPVLTVVAFRGTRSFRNWQTNIGIWPQQVIGQHASKRLRVHRGFYQAFSLLDRAGLVAHIRQSQAAYPELPVYLTGHSLGGALAQIASAVIGGDNLAACYTFGGPRVGNDYFDRWVKAPCYRVINYADIVPQIPPGIIYRHSGDPRYLPRRGHASPFRFQPGVLIRFAQFVAGLWQFLLRQSLLGIDDHSMKRYADKLNAVAGVRQQQRNQ